MPAAERSPEASTAAGCAGSRAPLAALHQRAHDDPDHMVQEAVGGNLDPDQPCRRSISKRGERSRTAGSAAGTEKERKSCSPSRQAPAARASPPTSSGRATCQAKRASRALARRAVENRIDVDSLAGRKARRETRRPRLRSRTLQSRGSSALSASRSRSTGKMRRRRKRHDLAGRMDAAVRAARPGDLYRFAQQSRSSASCTTPATRAQRGLPLKAAKLACRRTRRPGEESSDRSDAARSSRFRLRSRDERRVVHHRVCRQRAGGPARSDVAGIMHAQENAILGKRARLRERSRRAWQAAARERTIAAAAAKAA